MAGLLMAILMAIMLIYAFTYWKEIVAFTATLLVLSEGEFVAGLIIGFIVYVICWVISAINKKKGANDDF